MWCGCAAPQRRRTLLRRAGLAQPPRSGRRHSSPASLRRQPGIPAGPNYCITYDAKGVCPKSIHKAAFKIIHRPFTNVSESCRQSPELRRSSNIYYICCREKETSLLTKSFPLRGRLISWNMGNSIQFIKHKTKVTEHLYSLNSFSYNGADGVAKRGLDPCDGSGANF